MVDSRSPPSTSRSLRRLIAEYTPDGTVGRLLLSSVTGSLAFFAFWIAAVGLVEPGVLSALLGLLFGALSIATGVVTLLILWPIYLSLIGKVETPADYGETADGDADGREEDDPVAVLKREYATGELSESEFDRRLERLLGVEAVEQSRSGTDAAERGRPSTVQSDTVDREGDSAVPSADEIEELE